MPDHVHDDLDPAQVRGVGGDWVYQRQECDPLGAGVRRAQAEFCGSALLGARIHGFHGGADEVVIREYIRNQEQEDQRLDQLNLWKDLTGLSG